MTIYELLQYIMDLARRSNMTVEELLEWMNRNDRDEGKLPWEE